MAELSVEQITNQAKAKFDQAVSHFKDELKKIRTGRAHPGMLDGVMIEAYGTQMPLIQAGTISVPEPQQLQITPFDPNNLQAISSAIRDNPSLGLNPADDGRVVRIPIPPLTQERRQEYVKLLNSKVEDCMISMRNARHEALKDGEEAKKSKSLTEDDLTSLKRHLDEQMDSFKKQVNDAAKAKETEITTV